MAGSTRSKEADKKVMGKTPKVQNCHHHAQGHFLYLHYKEQKTVCEAATETINKILVEDFWKQAFIPVHYMQHSIKKVESIFMQWKHVQIILPGREKSKRKMKYLKTF